MEDSLSAGYGLLDGEYASWAMWYDSEYGSAYYNDVIMYGTYNSVGIMYSSTDLDDFWWNNYGSYYLQF